MIYVIEELRWDKHFGDYAFWNSKDAEGFIDEAIKRNM